MWRCRYCKTENPETSAVCRNCGRARLGAGKKKKRASAESEEPSLAPMWITLALLLLLSAAAVYFWPTLFPADLPEGEFVLNRHHVSLATGEEISLTLDIEIPEDFTVTWRSSAPEIASVNGQGLVRALRYGEAKITVETQDGRSDSCTVETMFRDVIDPNAYYYKPVYWAADKGITQGYDGEYFAPREECSYEQMLTFMWRMVGKPEASSSHFSFADVPRDAYYSKAVLWAADKGIASGRDDGRFGVGELCTREQALCFLWRLAGEPEVEDEELQFTDVTEEDEYYQAVRWAAETGIAQGYDDGRFGVGETCLREHIVTFLARYAELFL